MRDGIFPKSIEFNPRFHLRGGPFKRRGKKILGSWLDKPSVFYVQSQPMRFFLLPAEPVGNSSRLSRCQRQHLTGVVAPRRAAIRRSVRRSSSRSQSRGEKSLLCLSLLFFLMMKCCPVMIKRQKLQHSPCCRIPHFLLHKWHRLVLMGAFQNGGARAQRCKSSAIQLLCKVT